MSIGDGIRPGQGWTGVYQSLFFLPCKVKKIPWRSWKVTILPWNDEKTRKNAAKQRKNTNITANRWIFYLTRKAKNKHWSVPTLNATTCAANPTWWSRRAPPQCYFLVFKNFKIFENFSVFSSKIIKIAENSEKSLKQSRFSSQSFKDFWKILKTFLNKITQRGMLGENVTQARHRRDPMSPRQVLGATVRFR